ETQPHQPSHQYRSPAPHKSGDTRALKMKTTSKAMNLPNQVAVASTVIAAALVYRRAAMAGLGVLAFLYPLLFPGK
ncbi:hypothetical protein ACF05W_36975, partial [Streptomyces lydicus]|uniref:hypothetical protein n=1 Tax=Streptomyces lydicus TaxID=47763 RepID=UPI0036F8AC68